MLKWVKLKKYCQDSGDTANAVHAKRKKGVWLDGIQCKIGPDGNVWINLIEVEKWVEKGGKGTTYSLRGV
ncbi:hypothetical protein [Legionella erythra]|uniref:Phage excisionase n=1 Tax=Legionella erythra TaxID=448 RepID=A0A0W0TSU6_LEGER|nr:hypothetical protein [Legionella erythra]KTC98711.1 Phage excisionase [Legionella erythra]